MLRGIFVIGFALMVPAFAAAQAKTGAPQTFEQRLAAGHARYLAGDHDGAIEAYLAAKELEPGRAESYYLLGSAMLGAGRFEDAAVQLRTAVTVAGTKQEQMRAKALCQLARLEEARGDLEAAAVAWTQYADFLKVHPQSTGFPETPEARRQAIEKKQALDGPSAQVRERIAAATQG